MWSLKLYDIQIIKDPKTINISRIVILAVHQIFKLLKGWFNLIFRCAIRSLEVYLDLWKNTTEIKRVSFVLKQFFVEWFFLNESFYCTLPTQFLFCQFSNGKRWDVRLFFVWLILILILIMFDNARIGHFLVHRSIKSQ